MLSNSVSNARLSIAVRCKGQEQCDATVEQKECVAKCSLNLFLCPFHRSRVWHSPVSSHRKPRPHGTNLFRCIAANSNHEVEFGSIRSRELRPRLAPQLAGRYVNGFELLQCLEPHNTGRMTACTVRSESRGSLLVHDASAMIERAELPVHKNSTL